MDRTVRRVGEDGDMDWQTPEDTVPSRIVTDADLRSLVGRPPATGAWRDGDPPAGRRFANLGPLDLEFGGHLPHVRLAFETWGELSPARDNAVLITHALTGDSHARGEAGPGQPTAGWWDRIIGPGLAVDTDRWFVVVPNMLGGCQGSTGPASFAPDGREWGARFPSVSVRDQVAAQALLADSLGIGGWAAVVGGSMGGMHALEWAVGLPERVERVAILASPPVTTADQIALNAVQLEAIRMDPAWNGGRYYDAGDGGGPHRGLALARRMALLQYRSPTELNDRFGRRWQSEIDPLADGGRFAISSYLDFHGNKFTRRFDANSYITLVESMNSHDIARGRGSVEDALARVTARALVVGIDSDRLFPVEGQRRIAAGIRTNIDGDEPTVISSEFGHDGFLIEFDVLSDHLDRIFAA
jgi:homoserine O-acetyltransferase